jgi:hypothetical protein
MWSSLGLIIVRAGRSAALARDLAAAGPDADSAAIASK